MTPSHEDQGTGFDRDARGYELQGRKTAPNANLAATEARDDFATDPTAQTAPPTAPAAPAAASAAQDGPKAPEPVLAAPAASYAPEPPFVAYPELHPTHPARLPPAARPIKQG